MAARTPRPPADELRRLYVDERLSFDDLAARYHVSEGTVKRWLRAAGISRRVPGWAVRVPAEHLREPPTAAELWRGYLEERQSIKQVATHVGVSYATMRARLLGAGVPLRSPGRPGRGSGRAASLVGSGRAAAC